MHLNVFFNSSKNRAQGNKIPLEKLLNIFLDVHLKLPSFTVYVKVSFPGINRIKLFRFTSRSQSFEFERYIKLFKLTHTKLQTQRGSIFTVDAI